MTDYTFADKLRVMDAEAKETTDYICVICGHKYTTNDRKQNRKCSECKTYTIKKMHNPRIRENSRECRAEVSIEWEPGHIGYLLAIDFKYMIQEGVIEEGAKLTHLATGKAYEFDSEKIPAKFMFMYVAEIFRYIDYKESAK